jgi:enoyl-CoA hydratase/carnithine racemase
LSDPTVHIARDGAIVTLTLDNPPVNAVSTRLIATLHARLDEIEAMPDVRCVILTGAGERAFCAGADLREEGSLNGADAQRAFREMGRRTLNRIEHFRVPIVAAIHGYCIGGGTAIGWVCDIRVAADNAIFRAGDAYLGLVPSWGMGLTRLPRLVGRNRVLDILLIGENFDAPKAHELGLVTKVVPRAKLMEEAQAIAARISKASPNAILATRKAVAYGLRHDWDDMVRYEEEICDQVFSHPDAQEGPQAFTEKRQPNFKSL